MSSIGSATPNQNFVAKEVRGVIVIIVSRWLIWTALSLNSMP